MGQDKGKARQSLSWDKFIDRTAANLSDPGAAFQLKSYKSNISRKTADRYQRLADQFKSTAARNVITEPQGISKMEVKGFGN